MSTERWWWLWIVVVVLGVWAVSRSITFTRQITVLRTYRGGRGNRPYVVATDGSVYRYGNDLLTGDWNAAEEWGRLQAGATVTARGHGVRVPFLGMFPVITSYT